VFVYEQVVNGLLYLHEQGMVHKDIKPSNLLLFENGVVKIADFGVGHSFASAETVIGTPSYQAPEFLSEEGSLDPAKEDVWSLGVTIFESLFGHLPFVGETVYAIAQASITSIQFPKSASGEIRDLLTKMLCPDPEKRISIVEMAEHPFFKRNQAPVEEMAISPPRMKPSNSMVTVSAEVCDDNYVLVPPSTAGSWPGAGGMGIRQFPQFVC
jgi:serine/threonine-protein kinase 11